MRYAISLFLLLVTAFALPAYADSPLTAPDGTDMGAAMHNAEGIKAYGKGMYAEAAAHFGEAVKIAPAFARAHFNLGLALHGERKHMEAAEEFRLAGKLARQDKMITGSETLKAHLKM
jgi:Flp pilus assembly protein TadD